MTFPCSNYLWLYKNKLKKYSVHIILKSNLPCNVTKDDMGVTPMLKSPLVVYIER